MVKNITLNNYEKGEQYPLSYKFVGKNIKLESGAGGLNFWGKNQDLILVGMEKNINL